MTKPLKPQAIIVGGGVGGLTAAICLQKIGWDVTVFEQAVQIFEIGAGVQLSPNGVKILQEIGVMPLLERSLFEPEFIEIRIGKSGKKIIRIPMKNISVDRWGARFIQIHRADLITALQTKLNKLIPNSIHTNKKVISYQNLDGAAIIRLKNGAVHKADLVIGADGIHSTIRSQMMGPDVAHFTKNIAWRTIVPVDTLGDLAPSPTGCIWTGERKHAVTTRIRGGDLVNFVGIVEHSELQPEDWNNVGKRADAINDFRGWNQTITNLIEKADNLHKWALFDRKPLNRWHDGHVVLLGDAAHPMLPSMAQGAVQSIEDSYILAKSLSNPTTKDIPSACNKYFLERIKRVNRVQKISAKNLNLFHTSKRWKQLVHYTPIWLLGKLTPGLVQKRYDWLYGKEFGRLAEGFKD